MQASLLYTLYLPHVYKLYTPNIQTVYSWYTSCIRGVYKQRALPLPMTSPILVRFKPYPHAPQDLVLYLLEEIITKTPQHLP